MAEALDQCERLCVNEISPIQLLENMMKIEVLTIPEIKLVTPRKFEDERGFFSETYNAHAMVDGGIAGMFIQDNHSLSVQKGVVRGLHYQIAPRAQDKLVRVVKGAVFDVAVDIRKGSPTFGQHVSAMLSAENWQQLWIPKGFAHGFCTLEPYTEVVYKVTGMYSPENDRGLAWNDPSLGIEWPASATEAILSEKDKKHPFLADLTDYFNYPD